MKMNFTVTYPKVDRNWPYAEAQRDYNMSLTFNAPGGCTMMAVCDMIFSGMGNYPSTQCWLPEFFSLRTRSMSVGDVIRFENEPTAWICDSCGWLQVSLAMANSWLAFNRKHGCDMFELSQWKKLAGLDKR